jgi:D-serine deaminase-like pyridoxal phosphate-dependent protein
MRLAGRPTPDLILDEARMQRNIARLRQRLAPFGVVLRPHIKTAKSIDVARQLLTSGHGPATVSTLREAEALFEAGVTDILYAVGIAPHRLERVQALRARGCDLAIILDSVEQAEAVAAASGPPRSPSCLRSTAMATARA